LDASRRAQTKSTRRAGDATTATAAVIDETRRNAWVQKIIIRENVSSSRASVNRGVQVASTRSMRTIGELNVEPVTETTKTTMSEATKVVKPVLIGAIALAALTMGGPASAAAAKVIPVAVPADTCWILISSALVLFMTIPGLGAFYAGLVRRTNTLSVLIQCFALAAHMSFLWFLCGYSLSFSAGSGASAPFIGGLDMIALKGITMASLMGTIPTALHALYQMTFAIITPALMVGSLVERMKFNSVMWFSTLWMFAVYFPLCHMVWGGGLFADMGVLDFAGGIVVHITAGIGALVAAMYLGERKENKMHQGNLVLTFIGTAMLWVGWYGFNGGSAGGASAGAAFACLATQLSASVAAIVWTALDVIENGKVSVLGTCTASIAGLAAITPAAGFVGPVGACLMGLASAIVCRFFSTTVKEKFGYDDSLDVFGVHGVGGFLGTILVGLLGAPIFGGFLPSGTIGTQTIAQCTAAVATAVYTAVASYACLKATDVITGGIRVPAEAEEMGLDVYSHGETAYSPMPR
jgi:Amt family ammonium transporter